MFENMIWENGSLSINNERFYMGDKMHVNDNNSFLMYKDRNLIDQYQNHFTKLNYKSNNVFELGIYEGGSTAFWYEVLKPNNMSSIDIQDKINTAHFNSWQDRKTREDKSSIKTYWKTSQADPDELKRIVSTDFNNKIDIVIDDASHLYSNTLISFETLFPLINPGGIYIIEDWAWIHWSEWASQLPRGEDLSKLVTQMIQCSGTGSGIIENVTVCSGFAIIQRGSKLLDKKFSLSEYIYVPKMEVSKMRLKSKLKKVIKTLLAKIQNKKI